MKLEYTNNTDETFKRLGSCLVEKEELEEKLKRMTLDLEESRRQAKFFEEERNKLIEEQTKMSNAIDKMLKRIRELENELEEANEAKQKLEEKLLKSEDMLNGFRDALLKRNR